MIGKINGYADAHIAEGSRRDADTVMADIEFRHRLRKERLPAIDAWLAKNGGWSRESPAATQPGCS